MKTIKLKCLDNGTVEVSYPMLFNEETVSIHVDYPRGVESFIKYLDLKMGIIKENVVQNSLSMDHVLKVYAGTLEIQPYATEESKHIKWEKVKIPVKVSL